MNKDEEYIVGYVDESEEDIHEFLDFFEDCFTIVTYMPDNLTTIDDIISWILDEHLDIIIVDFDLKEKHSVDFYGTQILETLNKKHLNFPMFMFTGYEDSAIQESNALVAGLIYKKNFVYNNVEEFSKRIKIKVDKYKSSLEKARIDHAELIKKTTRSPEEENKLLEIDSFLEASYGESFCKLKSLKSTEYLEKLNDLINKTDKLLKEIDKNE